MNLTKKDFQHKGKKSGTCDACMGFGCLEPKQAEWISKEPQNGITEEIKFDEPRRIHLCGGCYRLLKAPHDYWATPVSDIRNLLKTEKVRILDEMKYTGSRRGIQFKVEVEFTDVEEMVDQIEGYDFEKVVDRNGNTFFLKPQWWV